MATNSIPISVSDNTERITLGVKGGGKVIRARNSNAGNPYYVGARAYVTQTEDGAVVTVIDKEGITTATVSNGADGQDGRDGSDGRDGADGHDGANGQDGVSPTVGISEIDGGHRITVTDARQTQSVDVMDGKVQIVRW